ncbi:hypothetical protein A9Q95_13655 [Rhodobacterales bacterium 59_46_T64]|nr:hypothetical protein A9Q95_13655 [Rhodobacterales bacterium 59_46_T64]
MELHAVRRSCEHGIGNGISMKNLITTAGMAIFMHACAKGILSCALRFANSRLRREGEPSTTTCFSPVTFPYAAV